MRNDSRDPLDAVIDHASQALVSGEPPASLRTGVRDRIGSRPRWAAVPAWSAAAAMVALAVLARVLTGGPDAPPRSGPENAVVVMKPPAMAVPAASEPVEREMEAGRGGGGASSPGRPVGLPEPLVELEPLIPPIEIEPLTTGPIVMADVAAATLPIEIEPLQIDLIDVAQLPTPGSQLPTPNSQLPTSRGSG